jgi:hypothetical protein
LACDACPCQFTTRCTDYVARELIPNSSDPLETPWTDNTKRNLIPNKSDPLTIGVYTDLNPVAAKLAKTPETSDYTSIKQRVDHAKARGKTAELEAATDGSAAGSHAAAGLEESLWLCPVEDRRELGSPREGMVPGFSLGSYIKLVDYSGRHFREGKDSISAELTGIFERLGCSAQSWRVQIEKLRGDRLLGRFFAISRAKLREIGERLGVRRVINLRACIIQ